MQRALGDMAAGRLFQPAVARAAPDRQRCDRGALLSIFAVTNLSRMMVHGRGGFAVFRSLRHGAGGGRCRPGAAGAAGGTGRRTAARTGRDDLMPIRVTLDEVITRRGIKARNWPPRSASAKRSSRCSAPARCAGIRFRTLARLCAALACQPGELLDYRFDEATCRTTPRTPEARKQQGPAMAGPCCVRPCGSPGRVDQPTLGSLKASISPLNASTGTQLQNTFLSP